MVSWVYIFIASMCEICWIYSLKYLEFKKLIHTNIIDLFSTKEGFSLLLPGLLYVAFGVGNIVCFSKGMEKLPASLAFGVWMATALVGVKLVDVLVLKETFSTLNYLFFALIIVGIIGLKLT